MLLEKTDKLQSLYVYEPDSFVPLARIDSELVWSEAAPAADDSWIEKNTLDVQGVKAIFNRRPEDILKVLQQSSYARQQVNPLAYLTAGGMPLGQMQENPKPQLTNSKTYWYHCDHLGTPQELTDRQGNMVWAADYKAWGRLKKVQRFESRVEGNAVRQVLVEQEPVVQNIRFQGQWEDAETGLYYNRFRYYDPDAVRYISQDPIGLMGGINTHAYVKNPTSFVDPLGLSGGCDSEILFGQKRISGNFRQNSGAPEFIEGRSISDVADDLKAGKIHPDQLPVSYFMDPKSGKKVAESNRTLAALSLAGMKPTKTICIKPPVDVLKRLAQAPIKYKGGVLSIPGRSIAITPGPNTDTVLQIITLPG